ncbi:MAG: Flp pilus assembly complex ATPase component TadA [Burkholderiales bacterium]|jgi:type II secretory ATPase GspE/PulE/Tfp pilus assembly ATPase PilB-like protein|nr:Flp pilus assembly complex ATPase component TadA [Burkholderiales bacterium]
MSTVLQSKPAAAENLAEKVNFQQKLQGVTNKIHATKNIDEIILEMSQELCTLFNADRLTIYLLSEDKGSIISKVKTGLTSFKDIKLPINEQSIAGFVAANKRVVNIRDVYDDAELKSYSAQLNFLKAVDAKTGYRTKQMLVAPVLDAKAKDLIGVVQIINNKAGQPFPPMMEEGVLSLTETLAIAFRQRQGPMMQVRSKYDGLVTNAVISGEELELAQRSARRKNLDVEVVLKDEFQVKLPALGDALGTYFGVPYEPFKQDRIKPPDLMKNMNREFCQTNQWVPLDDTKEGIIVMTTDPERVKASRMVSNVFPKSKIIFRVTTNTEFVTTLDQMFGAGSGLEDSGNIEDMLGTLDDESEGEGAGGDDVASAAADNELVKLVNKIIIDAYQMGASDIHIEPYPGKAKTEIRFRRDGSLQPYIQVPASYRSALAARLKIMCDLDISERRRPQDGKIKFKKFGPLDIELRVATIPSAGGVEDIVMRILAAGEPIPLDKLGLTKYNNETLKETVSKPYGLFFVCGPTGSGKTTTLHSVLGYLNTSDTKIWTAEDPVEITQKGLRQVQMNPKAGMTFAVAMKAFLRADPDIIMVGEMRDKETTGTGIEASLTGHLVFATLHTNSAPESIIRLLDMGMDPFNFADALLGILAQRLAKRLCGKCKKPHDATTEEIQALIVEYAQELKNTETWKKDPKAAEAKLLEDWIANYGGESGKLVIHDPVGCEVCGGSGYKGRVGLHELLVGTDALKKNIQEHARVAEMVATALEDGMRTLKQDGIEKVLMGITDMKQVRAVCIK